MNNGDHRRTIAMKFVRDTAFRDALQGVSSNTKTWINYYGETRSGQQYAISRTPGVALETIVAGSDQTVKDGKVLASAIFSVWFGDNPIRDGIKKGLVSRAPAAAS